MRTIIDFSYLVALNLISSVSAACENDKDSRITRLIIRHSPDTRYTLMENCNLSTTYIRHRLIEEGIN